MDKPPETVKTVFTPVVAGTIMTASTSWDDPELAELEAHGFYLCDGREIPTEKFPGIAGILTDAYGGRPGFFNLPNLRAPENNDEARLIALTNVEIP